MSETKLKEEILELEKIIFEKKKILFLNRLKLMYNNDLPIDDIKIEINENDWNITYTHTTQKYDINNYLYEESVEYKSHEKTTIISVGKLNKKYYIKGGIKLNIYKSKKEIMIINPDYDLEIDIDEHIDLIRSYMKNPNIPEAVAISILMYISDNKWDDDSIIIYLGTV
jgi:hypothetical protein